MLEKLNKMSETDNSVSMRMIRKKEPISKL